MGLHNEAVGGRVAGATRSAPNTVPGSRVETEKVHAFLSLSCNATPARCSFSGMCPCVQRPAAGIQQHWVIAVAAAVCCCCCGCCLLLPTYHTVSICLLVLAIAEPCDLCHTACLIALLPAPPPLQVGYTQLDGQDMDEQPGGTHAPNKEDRCHVRQADIANAMFWKRCVRGRWCSAAARWGRRTGSNDSLSTALCLGSLGGERSRE